MLGVAVDAEVQHVQVQDIHAYTRVCMPLTAC